jgi:predicted metalloprotease with PDZ domain
MEKERVKFKLNLDQRNYNIFNVTMLLEAPSNDFIIELPSWTPGSYLIREYAKNIQKLYVNRNGSKINPTKISKNNWKIPSIKGDKIEINYEVYSFEFSVRTNYLDDRKGLLNGTATFFYPVIIENGDKKQLKDMAVEIDVDLPNRWSAFTSLDEIAENVFYAEDYDELFDSPIGFGYYQVIDTFDYNYKETPCKTVIIGDKGSHDIAKFSDDLIKLQDYSIKMFGELPYDRYLWLLYIVETGGGGLEHKKSNVSITNRFAFHNRENYLNTLRLESHEHFHVYNVKRIRPKPLGPFDYENEVYTTSLWVAEGLTNYYEKIFLIRSKIYTIEEYQKALEDAINNYFSIYGRKIQSITESSFDAWIKLYRPDENTRNSTISYYLKGGLVGQLLDIEIRKGSKDTKSLDDVFRLLWTKYKENPAEGYNEKELPEIIHQATGVSVSEFFSKYVYGRDELPLEEYLDYIGLSLSIEEQDEIDFTGVQFARTRLRIRSVNRDSNAKKAGLSARDQILAVNGYKVTPNNYTNILSFYKSGDIVRLHIFRDDKLLEYDYEIETKPPVYRIITKENLSSEEQTRFNQYFDLTEKTVS